MAHLLGRCCLDFTIHAEVEGMAHLLDRYCLDFTIDAEVEAMAHPRGRHLPRERSTGSNRLAGPPTAGTGSGP
jgi:hypothetical protein